MLEAQIYWAVEEFSFTTYLFYFTEFFDPNIDLYKASLGDGSIKLIEDEEFVAELGRIYISGTTMIDRLLEREIEENRSIEDYLSITYGSLFIDQSIYAKGIWIHDTQKRLLHELVHDGTFRFKLQQKLAMLRSKQDILTGRIMTPIDELMENHNK